MGGPPAPEGSEVKVEARRRLVMMARRQIRLLERKPEDWVLSVYRHAPQLAGAVGEDDVRLIALVVSRF